MDVKTAKSIHLDTVILESNRFLPLYVQNIFFPVAEMFIDCCQTKRIVQQIPGFSCVAP